MFSVFEPIPETPSPTLDDLTSYIEERKDRHSHLKRWDRRGIGLYLKESVACGHIRYVVTSGKISGVVIFRPELRGQFWIEQIFADCRSDVKVMIEALMREYPNVTEVYGWRRGNRHVKFNLSTLKKIYGR